MEKWKEIQKKKMKTYYVSNEGKIKSIDNKNGKKHYFKMRINGNGYYEISIARKTAIVHRLVAKAFIPNLENKRTVNHIDGNKLNNAVENLEWNTHQENNLHARANGLMVQGNVVVVFSKFAEIVGKYESKSAALRALGYKSAGTRMNQKYNDYVYRTIENVLIFEEHYNQISTEELNDIFHWAF